VQMMGNEASTLPESNTFHVILGQIRWAPSAVIDTWLREMLTAKHVSPHARASCAESLLNRARDRGDFATVVDCAIWFVSDLDVQRSGHAYDLQRLIGEIAAVDEATRGALLAEAEQAPTTLAAVAWLEIIPQIGGVAGVLTAFQLVERFGETELPVIGSLAPTEQGATHLSFGGWAFLMRRAFHFYPEIMGRLFVMLDADDEALRAAARRAILWIERERIEGHSPSMGARGRYADDSADIWPIFVGGDRPLRVAVSA